MMKEQMRQVVKDLNHVSWRRLAMITPEADALVREHIVKMRKVIEALRARGMSISDAYAMTQSAGNQDPEYDVFFDILWDEAKFQGAGTREPMILSITSSYFWDRDPDLKDLENPWLPIMELYKMGYTSSFDEGPGEGWIDLIIGYRDEEQIFELYRPGK